MQRIATGMNCPLFCLLTGNLISVLLQPVSPVFADGLIYRLPDDGTAVELKGASEGEAISVICTTSYRCGPHPLA